MKLSLNWLESYFNIKPNWNMIFDKLTMAGIELESIVLTDDNLDKVIEFKITPNRGDCLSIDGILREIILLCPEYKENITRPIDIIKDLVNTQNNNCIIQSKDNTINHNSDTIKIINHATDIVPIYNYIVIKKVLPTAVNYNKNKMLPDFIYKRLALGNINSVSLIVDILNYIMLELGQPMHAFNLDAIGNKLYLEKYNNTHNNANKTLHLLNKSTCQIIDNSLVSLNENHEVIAIPGVMGGINSSTNDELVSIFIESAWFQPDTIAYLARTYKLSTDASYRFERGVDPRLSELAIRYACYLFDKYTNYEVQISHINEYSTSILSKSQKIIDLDLNKINLTLGLELTTDLILSLLQNLDFIVLKYNAESLQISLLIPEFRFDINIAEDIVEEIARTYSYQNIVPKPVLFNSSLTNTNSYFKEFNILKSQLAVFGYHEIITYAFVNEKLALLFNNHVDNNLIKVKNPIANLNIMRHTLIIGLLQTLEYNINRGIKSLKLFELARIFYKTPDTTMLQINKLAGLIYGNYYIDINVMNNASNRLADFYDIKNDLMNLLNNYFGVWNKNLIHLQSIDMNEHQYMHPKRSANIIIADIVVGVVGQLHPKYIDNFNFNKMPYVFELDLDTILSLKYNNYEFNAKVNKLPNVKIPFKFPKVERDLSFLISLDINIANIKNILLIAKIPNLIDIIVFDIYKSDSMDILQKSVAIKVVFQADYTLTELEIANSMFLLTKILQDQFNIDLRA